MKTDIEISQSAELKNISEIASSLNISNDQMDPYGKYKAKINLPFSGSKNGKLILVTSINPTAAGEGKTTLTIGLGDAFHRINKSVAIALREPSLGPVMGIKGGATGGGYAQVAPMEDINLFFTGDFPAITEAHDTLSALIDNHIHHGNKLNIDPRTITWKRVVDINDRELRNVIVGLGGRTSGVPREDGFDITVASEIMAVLCLSEDLNDLKEKLGKILIGYNYDRQPVTVNDLGVTGALALLLKDAINPNLVQTLEHTPAFIHGGPFANIAHGCNSILATKAAIQHADYAITEAGFGADLGGEKFLDITSEKLGKRPDAIVIVATVRALKLNGGVNKNDLDQENVGALLNGAKNLGRHIANMKQYNKPVVVAVNEFTSDTEKEINALNDYIKEQGVKPFNTTVWENGGAGATELAEELVDVCDNNQEFKPLYNNDDEFMDKLNAIVTKIYGGNGVVLSNKAKTQLKKLVKNGWDKLPICVAKTQYSFTDNAKELGAPVDFSINVSDIQPKLGAGFIVVLTGKILTMPGLPSHPAALDMDIDNDGKITGLF
ncbi:Formate--tetrahydrofolate ligase 1 [Apilactobacillus kunkeei]|uniref:formate--tetrahydrofolate ligase n=1 Tax=Apilactobacillus kunkeei TaxID=148814 RepID=UPI00200ADC06|nr:formate--tetrahydrofolate ligase [Apilactobacillus kunkeei]MCK8633813.1 formate--tetrahydrofolate ligase [Apilactobacillus kunkeei]CAI2593399.1 Formate--tetrahydrofolate ligase 1 [Apilactobacillus kunkeei]CAI2593407.1 Formate--tetrahydrofolate ligase 1 [Apilactobacillus kunkeei]CAI2593965.1 Formate--tetrahydrofolate ligase 1 [Apilactobacillus kunkeei]CAI2594375.1 Formate--tetrahydrofolate ligase 1 [Apilactobacillus kunkeei]